MEFEESTLKRMDLLLRPFSKHTTHTLIVWLAFRTAFLRLSDHQIDCLSLPKCHVRAEFLRLLGEACSHLLHGMNSGKNWSRAINICKAGHFRRNSELNEIFKDVSENTIQSADFRASMHLPPLEKLIFGVAKGSERALSMDDFIRSAEKVEAVLNIVNLKLPRSGVPLDPHIEAKESLSMKPESVLGAAVLDHSANLSNTLEQDFPKIESNPKIEHCSPRITRSGAIKKISNVPALSAATTKAVKQAFEESVRNTTDIGPYNDTYKDPKYLPFRIQHSVLSVIQYLLEEALFNFAQKHYPATLQQYGYHIPENVELTYWGHLLEDFVGIPTEYLANGYSPGYVKTLHVKLRTVRHAAVHRKQKIPVEALYRMSLDAVELAKAVQDPTAIVLEAIRDRIQMIFEKSLKAFASVTTKPKELQSVLDKLAGKKMIIDVMHELDQLVGGNAEVGSLGDSAAASTEATPHTMGPIVQDRSWMVRMIRGLFAGKLGTSG